MSLKIGYTSWISLSMVSNWKLGYYSNPKEQSKQKESNKKRDVSILDVASTKCGCSIITFDQKIYLFIMKNLYACIQNSAKLGLLGAKNLELKYKRRF